MARAKGLKRRRADLALGSTILARVHRHMRQGYGRSMDASRVPAAKDAELILDKIWRDFAIEDLELRREENLA